MRLKGDGGVGTKMQDVRFSVGQSRNKDVLQGELLVAD